MKCSATLESVGVRDIGRLKSVVKSSIFAFLGNGTTFAYFHILGRDPSAIDELIIILTGRASSYEKSRIIQLGILSGPPAFDVFMDLRSTAVSSGEIFGTYESAVWTLYDWSSGSKRCWGSRKALLMSLARVNRSLLVGDGFDKSLISRLHWDLSIPQILRHSFPPLLRVLAVWVFNFCLIIVRPTKFTFFID